MTAPAPGG